MQSREHFLMIKYINRKKSMEYLLMTWLESSWKSGIVEKHDVWIVLAKKKFLASIYICAESLSQMLKTS